MNFFTHAVNEPPGHLRKLVLVMKLTIVLMIAAMMQVSAATFAQKVTLHKSNATLESIFTDIRNQTGYDFLGDAKLIRQANPVTIDVKDAPLQDVLDQCFQGQNLTYTIEEKTVVVKEKDPSLAEKNHDFLNPSGNITGTVTDSVGTPLIGATISLLNTKYAAITDDEGRFTLSSVPNGNYNIVVTYIGYKKFIKAIEIKGSDLNMESIVLHSEKGELKEVVISTGYQTLPAERATGSFDYIDNELLNRSVSTSILDRLNGVTSGLTFNTNSGAPGSTPGGNINNQSTITINGRSTINSNPNPLIVVDNFPYDGDINNINPNDVESITILKDAAAASIWGAFSGNGVIVITTKKGNYNQPIKVSFNSNVTLIGKPDLYYTPMLNSSDYINMEEYLFANGYYTSTIANGYSPISPVVDILNQEQNGLISTADANSQINALRSQDVRSDENKYFYRTGVDQQYALNLSGGGKFNKYYFSAGYDNNLPNVVTNQYNRLTLNGNDSYSLLNNKLELTSNIVLTEQNNFSSGAASPGALGYPYEKLADANGNPLPVYDQWRKEFIDTAGSGQLLNWIHYPLNDLNSQNNKTGLTDYRLNFGAKYKIIPELNLNLMYQYENSATTGNDLLYQNSFYVTNLINSYTQINGNSVTRPIPLGDILNTNNSNASNENFRTQINYIKDFNPKNSLTAIAGAEIRDVTTSAIENRFYGYDNDLETSLPVDYVDYFPLYATRNSSLVPYINNNSSTAYHFLSYFTNAAYTYDNKYILSASARKDESNIFGVDINQKGVPLWSVGASWQLNKEKFYHVDWLPNLKLRVTDGYNGNINPNLAAVVTASANSHSQFGSPALQINNAPNPELSWEKVNTANFGIDFGLIKNILTGSFDYFIKNGRNLIGTAPIDPTTGISQFSGNVASMNGNGFNVNLESHLLNSTFKWTIDYLLSYANNKTTSYYLNEPSISSQLNNLSSINPIVGYPLYSIFALKWAGLTHQTGDPQVFLDGNISSDYSSILSSTNLNNLKYMGSAVPLYFGSIRNTFSYKQLSLSFNIIYKLDYYFRRTGLNYYSLFGGIAYGNADYTKRWQNPGDEAFTNVPSLIYPDNPSRDYVYQYSSVLVDNADNIRLQDVRLNYNFNKTEYKGLPFNNLSVYAYASNLLILWKANKDGIDPDVVPGTANVYPNPRSISIGVNANF